MADFDITVNATIADDSITNAKLANAPEATFKLVPVGSGTSNPIDGDADQAMEILALATDPPLVAADLAGYIQDGQTLSTGLAFPSGGLRVKDSAASQELGIVVNEDLTANRLLKIIVNDANKTLDLTGDASLEGVNTGDQDLSGLLTEADADLLYDPLTQNRPNNTTPDLSFHYFPVYDPGDAQSEKTDGVEIKSWLAGEFDALGAAAAAQAAAISAAATDATTKANAAQAAAISAAATDATTKANAAQAAAIAAAAAGNSATATALQTARNIDGQSFNGTANITVIAPATHAATDKATPVDADELPLVDSAASNVLKKLTWANLKATLFTTIGRAIAQLANPGAVTFLRMNADNTATARTAAEMRTDLGLDTAMAVTVPMVPVTNSLIAPATYVWTNQPAALTFFQGAGRWVHPVSLTNRRQAKINVFMPTAGTVTAGSKIRLLYRTQAAGYDGTVSNWTQLGSAAQIEVVVAATVGVYSSAWIDLAAGAMTDVLIVVAGIDGNGADDPQYVGIDMEYR